uniref:ATP-dependent RNA helicase n=2 Tax=Acrobeloides nanus TaxID=290746 RepID=A0A914DH30_9BILA
MDWTLPTDIQSEGIPAILGGGDVLMAAETGSGKTGAFCLPVLQIVYETMRDQQAGKYKKKFAGQEKDWKINIFDKERNLGVDGNGLRCESTHPKFWSGARCNKGVVGKGKYYYEAYVETDGLCRVGWSTSDGSLNLGTDPAGFGFGGTGKKSNAGSFDDYGESFTLYDTIGCFIDLDNGVIHFSKNDHEFGTAFEISQQLINSVFYPAIVIKNARILLNFGATVFKFPPQNGYVGLTQAPIDFVRDSPITAFGNSDTNSEKRPHNAPMCLILEPTKELAQQTHNQIENFKKYLDAPKIRNILVMGGISMTEQMNLINDGVDIITAAPGRISDLVAQNKILLSNIRFFILDEADSLVSTQSDCFKILQQLHSHMPKYSPEGYRLQMIVCSATLHNSEVKKLADQFMHFPQWVDLKGQDSVPDTVHQVVCIVDPKNDKSWIRLRSKIGDSIATDGIHSKDEIRPGRDDPETLSEAIKTLKGEYIIKAIDEHKMDKCIIFCRTRLDCDNLEKFLTSRNKGYTCACLHSDRSPDERTRNLDWFKTGKARFLICTDVAARGIDVRGVPYVINMTLPTPEEKANYVHRIGRVGRAQRMGLAISLVASVGEKVWYHKCQSRGANCFNTHLVNQGGCARWLNEMTSLAEIEEHLGVTVNRVGTDFIVPMDEFDGKVVYGAKRSNEGGIKTGHAVELSGVVQALAELERSVQLSYLQMIAPPSA